ncbi:MAG TPA: tetratricopeptide repeat protein [Anaerolineaceae bacterium]|nr:tetratricopeptide repeat protein [Anaerolineaceae bacterium]HPN53924.1 tetratricopeptide repeat protein [Anaerolineaceae bacterium]
MKDLSVVEDHFQQGNLAFQNRRYTEAAAAFRAAGEAARAAGDALKAAEMDNNLAVVLLQSGDPAGALKTAEGTDALFADAADPQRQAIALGNQAAALEALGRRPEALEKYKTCSALLKQVNDPQRRVSVLKSISALQMRSGQFLEALVSMQAALDQSPQLSLRERMLKGLIDIPFRILNR